MTSLQIALPVQPNILVVPDGGDANNVRLSLRVTPAFVPEGTPGAIALAEWPSEIARIARSIRVEMAAIKADGKLQKRTTVGDYPPAGSTGIPAAGAMRLWEETFTPDQLESLWNELADPEGNRTAAAKAAIAAPVIAPRFDLNTLGEALVRGRAAAAAVQVDLLLSLTPTAFTPLVAPLAAQDAPMTELEAWAVPGTARDPLGKLRETALRDAQAQKVKAAVNDALSVRAPSATWRGADSHALLYAIQMAEGLEGRSDQQLAKACADCSPLSGPELIKDRMESLLLAAAAAVNPASAGAAIATIGSDPLADPVVEPGDGERRKLAGILSSPTIAKYLGMIVDLELPRSEWEAAKAAIGVASTGAVTATIAGSAGATPVWTAWLQFDPAAKDGRPAYFGPCDMSEALGKSNKHQKFVRGMLNLQAYFKDGGVTKARYSLEVIDVVNSAMRQNAFARDLLEARRRGMPGDEETPELGGRGIALLDNDRGEDEVRSVRRQQALQASGLVNKVLFADDLVVGYRPAVGITLKAETGLNVVEGRWRSLIGRSIQFDSSIDSDFVRANFNAEREQGHTRSLVTRQQSGQFVLPELFVWTGDSLAAPSPKERQSQEMHASAAEDLPVGITYGLPPANEKAKLGLTPLREGRCYVFGMSAMFVNGCGQTVAEAIKAHSADTSHLLGENGNAFRFRRAERIPPPVVLLRAGTKIVEASDMQRLHGESLTTLVVRETGDRAQRYLFPARVEFDRAEQQNMFDKNDSNVPGGAFRRVGVRRHKTSGVFARALDGRVDVRFKDGDDQVERSRGPVIEFEAPSSAAVEREYYPDEMSRGVWTRFSPLIPSNGQMEQMTAPVAYRTTDAAVDSLPVMLELKRAKSGTAPRCRVDQRDHWSPDQPEGRPLRKISIELAPATIVEVALDSDFDANKILENHLIAGALADLWQGSLLTTKGRLAQRLEESVRAGRIDEIQGVGKLRLVHAVRKPLRKPVNAGIVPVLVTVAPENAPNQKQLRKWSRIIGDNLPATPLSAWSEEGGATCFFIGKSELDLPSTGSLSLDARWQDWGPEMVRKDRNIWMEDRSNQFARLFTLSEFESATNRKKPSEADSLDLMLDPLGKPRSLSFTFRDGRARYLDTKLVGLTRFLEYYDRRNATSSVPLEAGSCERVSEEITKLWIPCTFRPAPLRVQRITPWFTYAKGSEEDRRTFTFVRTTHYRIELGRDCYTSGQGELVGLVFNEKQPQICDYASELLRPFASGVTRWGRDPLHQTGVDAENIPPARFTGQKVSGEFDLLAGADPVIGGGMHVPSISVTALGYEIHFDSKIGEFFCDIHYEDPAYSGNQPYMPFVQLGLVRFQPNCVAGLELSLPVGETIQLLPIRRGAARFRKPSDGHRFSFDLRGPLDQSGTIRLNLTALEYRQGGWDYNPEASHWRPQINRGTGKVAQMLGIVPNQPDGWHVEEFRMPRNRFDEPTALLVEEYEVFQDLNGNLKHKIVCAHIIEFGPVKPPTPAFADGSNDERGKTTEFVV